MADLVGSSDLERSSVDEDKAPSRVRNLPVDLHRQTNALWVALAAHSAGVTALEARQRSHLPVPLRRTYLHLLRVKVQLFLALRWCLYPLETSGAPMNRLTAMQRRRIHL